jgi:hypothetical protein
MLYFYLPFCFYGPLSILSWSSFTILFFNSNYLYVYLLSMNLFQPSRLSQLTLLKNIKFVFGYSSVVEHMIGTRKVVGSISTIMKT